MSKYFNSNKDNKFKLRIQLFADSADGAEKPEDAGADGQVGGENGAEGSKPEGTKLSFQDFLKQDGMQSEFDRLIAKSLETAKSNWDKDLESIVSGKITEAQKLNNMTEAQKKEYERVQKEQALTDREKAITVRELTAEAKSQLIDKGLSAKFSDFLNYDSAETVSASIETLAVVWQEEIQKGVEDRLKSTETPPAGSAGVDERFKQWERTAGVAPKNTQ